MTLRVNSHPFIPKGFPIVTQAGLFAPRSVLKNINSFLESYGEVHGLVNPNILLGKSMEDAKNWLTRKINEIRLPMTKVNIGNFWNALKKQREIHGKENLVQKQLNLSNDLSVVDLKRYVVEQVISFFENTKGALYKQVMALKPESSPCEQLSKLFFDYQRQFIENLQAFGLVRDNLHAVKVLNSVFDTLAPRLLVLMGHSLGGVVAIQAAQEGNNDIALALAWGAPINGAEPKAFPLRFVTHRIFPVADELQAGSEVLKSTAISPIPIDTSVFSIVQKDGTDSVILDSTLNNGFNAHNVKVESRQSSMYNILPKSLYPISAVSNHPPPFLKNRTNRFRYHMGYVDKEHVPFYWSEEPGSLLYEFAISDAGIQNIKHLLDRSNFSKLQTNFIYWLQQKVAKKDIDINVSQLKDELSALTDYPLPFVGSEYFAAQELLAFI